MEVGPGAGVTSYLSGLRTFLDGHAFTPTSSHHVVAPQSVTEGKHHCEVIVDNLRRPPAEVGVAPHGCSDPGRRSLARAAARALRRPRARARCGAPASRPRRGWRDPTPSAPQRDRSPAGSGLPLPPDSPALPRRAPPAPPDPLSPAP